MAYTSEVTAASAVTGVQLAAPGDCRCHACGTTLRDGRLAVAYAYQPVDQATWDVPRVYCPDCAPDEIGAPTLGVHEVVATAWLGVRSTAAGQHHRLVLTNVEITAASPPTDGASP